MKRVIILIGLLLSATVYSQNIFQEAYSNKFIENEDFKKSLDNRYISEIFFKKLNFGN